MFCHNCGTQLSQEQGFCPYCGVKLSAMIQPREETEEVKKEKKKFSFCGFLSGIVVVGALLLILLLGKSQGDPPTYEQGFSSPEEAVTAYLEGLRDRDVEKMLSSFATESYCENLSSRIEIQSGKRGLTLYLAEPCKSVGVIRKYADPSRYISQAYLTLVQQPDGEFVFSPNGFPVEAAEDAVISSYLRFREDKDQIEEFAELLRENQDRLSTLKIGDFLSLKEFSSMSKADYTEYTDEIAERYGMDEIETVVVEVELDGYELYFVMDTVCYDGVWYNQGGFISSSTADKIEGIGSDLFGTQ